MLPLRHACEMVFIGRLHSADARISMTLEHLARNFNKEVSVEQLMKIACLSRPQFHRRFKTLVGSSPHDLLIRLRLREAEQLLLNSNLSVAEIGERIGWRDQFYFSRRFRQAYGVSPGAFRRKKEGALL